MRTPVHVKILVPLIWLAFYAVDAQAAIDNAGVFDNVLDRYSSAASSWASTIVAAATRLFWTLVVISMVWTFGMMALRKADIGEFFAEFVRFTIFTGFFWWALSNGPNFATSIYDSLRQLGGNATGLGQGLSPSSIVDVGFAIFVSVMDQSSVWTPVDSMAGILMAVAILVILALVGVNMLLLLASGWVLAYGGVFFLGFGGSRWTSDMAINYYKVVLGLAAQLFAMVLLVGIGKTFLDDYYSRMSAGISIKEMGVMLIVVIILLALVNKIPPLIAGIISGASVGGAGIGQFGAGAAFGAAGMAAAAAATGGAALAAGAASAAGGASAMMAAFSKASDNVATGSDVLSAFTSASSGTNSSASGSQSGSSFTGAGSTPFSQAAGFAGGTGTGAATAGRSTSSGSGADGFGGSGQGAEKTGSSTAGSGKMTSQGANQAAGKEPKPAGEAGQDKQASPGATGTGGLASALGTAGRMAADAGANLARGTAEVARAKGERLFGAAQARVAETTGGKIAAAIRALDSAAPQDPDAPVRPVTPTFDGNSLQAAASEVDSESEVAAFTSRPPRSDGTHS